MNEFVIVIDTREQTPFFRKPPKGLLMVRDTLKTGDYSIKGFENEICVERKNMDDFISSVTVDSTRFRKELERMQDYPRRIIVVEGELSKVLGKCKPSAPAKKLVKTRKGFRPKMDFQTRNIHPNSIKGAVTAISFVYGIQIYFAPTRTEAERFTLDGLKKWYRMKREGM